MEIEYKRIMGKNYFVRKLEDGYKDSYEEKMLLNNSIPRLIPMESVMVDGKKQHIYSITSKQSLKNYMCAMPLKEDILIELLNQLQVLCRTLPEYLLTEDGLCLDLSYIFVDLNASEFCFCYFIGKEKTFSQELQSFAEQLIQSMDYKEEAVVHFVYQFYQKIVTGCTDLKQLTDYRDSKLCEEDDTIIAEFPKDEEEDYYMPLSKWERWKKQFLQHLQKKRKKAQKVRDCEVLLSAEPEAEQKEPPRTEWKECMDHFPTVLLTEPEEKECYLKYEGTDCHADFILPEGDFIIGKNADCVEGYIRNEKVSRMHALIRKKEDGIFLQDLNSTNGTYLNKELLNIQEVRKLNNGDEIIFADVPYRVCVR